MATLRRLGILRQIGSGGSGFGPIVQTLFTTFLMQALNILTGMVTARFLAPAGRGDLAAMIMWPQFLATACSFGMQISLIFEMRAGPERHGELVATALLLGILSGLIAAIIGILGIPYWLHSYPPQIIRFAQWAMLTAPFTPFAALLAASAQAVQDFGRFNKFRAFPPVLILCALLLAAGLHLLSPRTAAFCYLFSNVPVLFWNGLWVTRRFQLRFDRLRVCGRALLGFGIRAWGMDLIGSIADQVDRVLVVAFLTPRDMGLYVVAQSSARLFSVIPGGLQLVMAPKIVLLGPREGAPLVVRTARITFMVMCAGAVPLGVIAPLALGLVYGHGFAACATIFRILLAEAVLGGFTSLLAQGFSALGKPGRATLQQLVGLSASVPLLLFLVPRFGIDGACYALLISTAIRSGFGIWSYRALFGESLMYFLPRMADIEWIAEQVRPRKPRESLVGFSEEEA